MKVTLKSTATAGTVSIEPGEYLVTARADIMAIQLVGRGKDYLVPAIRRPLRAKGGPRGRGISVSFYSLGGGQWSLLVAVPKQGEFLATLKYHEQGTSKGSAPTGAGVVYQLDNASKAKPPGSAVPDEKSELPGLEKKKKS